MDNAAKAHRRALEYKKILDRHGVAADDVSWDVQVRTWDLRLRYQGAQLVLVVDADDPDFASILMPNFWWFRPSELPIVLHGIESVNRTCKCGKVHVSAQGDDVTASVEFFDTDGQGSAALVRYLHATLAAARAFVAGAEPDVVETTSGRETGTGRHRASRGNPLEGGRDSALAQPHPVLVSSR